MLAVPREVAVLADGGVVDGAGDGVDCGVDGAVGGGSHPVAAVDHKRLAAMRRLGHWVATLPWGVLAAVDPHVPGILVHHHRLALLLVELVDCIAPFCQWSIRKSQTLSWLVSCPK